VGYTMPTTIVTTVGSANDLSREYEQSFDEERTLWKLVKGHHPGTREHVPELWAKWMQAAARIRPVLPQKKPRR
jgi:hypothetical protein